MPGNPLKELNAWLILGKKRHLLVDNGFNMRQSEAALLSSLDGIGVKTADLDFFITHLHSDHNGLTHKLAAPGAAVYSGRLDGEKINAFITDPGLWKRSLANLGAHGFPDDELADLLGNHPGKIYANNEPLDFVWIEEGDRLEYGDYVFEAVFTPGHTPGCQMLREAKRNFLISGDHILGSITPNITCWSGVGDSLGDYLASLDKTDALDAQTAYPGHRAIVEDVHNRIEELREHHKRRLAEAESVLNNLGEGQAYEIAALMSWNLRGRWQDYHAAQKCFAVGEAAAHLDHLAAMGKIEKATDGHTRYLSRRG